MRNMHFLDCSVRGVPYDLSLYSCKVELTFVANARKKARKITKYLDLLAAKQILIHSNTSSTLNAMNFLGKRVLKSA